LAKVVFLQRDPIEWLGIMYLSAMLKSHGHQATVIVERLEDGECVDRALDEDADIYAFSPLLTELQWVRDRSARLKEQKEALVVLGGTHVTLNPEETLAHPAVDVVCVGEGEHPLLELAEAMDAGNDWSRVPNLWVKHNGTIRRNDVRDLLKDLDALPFPDRDLYSGYAMLRQTAKRPLHIGRGCPYSCTYCHNASKRELFAHKGPYVRWRTVDSVLGEVEELAATTTFKVLHFVDDGFGINHDWLGEFLPRMAALFDDPPTIFANMRADMVTDELCSVFEEYGSHRMRLRFAVECGDETYRREVLRKTIGDTDLRRAAALLHAHGIGFSTYNMVGLPGETLEQAITTLRLNVELKPSEAICFLYQPYPGTPLAQLAVESGAIDAAAMAGAGAEDFPGNFESLSPLRENDTVQLENVQRLFGLVVDVPALFPLARRLVTVRWLAPLFRLVFRVYHRAKARQRRGFDGY